MTRVLLNTLFVQTQGAYIHLEGETLKIRVDEEQKMQVPLHHLGGIVVFGNVLMSPFLLHRCAEDGRSVVWCDVYGRFKARMEGPVSGNVLLRRAHHRASENQEFIVNLARRFIEGKVKGARYVMQRAYRDYKEDVFSRTADSLEELLPKISSEEDLEGLRAVSYTHLDVYKRQGLEGWKELELLSILGHSQISFGWITFLLTAGTDDRLGIQSTQCSPSSIVY